MTSPLSSTPGKTPSRSGDDASTNADSRGLIDRPGRGRKRHYDDQSIERIVEDTLHSTPEQATHWSTRTMAKHAGVSHTTVQRIWHAHELKPHLLHTFKLSNDKRFVEKTARRHRALRQSTRARAGALCR